MILKFCFYVGAYKKIFLTPNELNFSIICSIIGLLPTGISGFGKNSVKGFSLDPLPPAIITTETSESFCS